MKQRKIILIGWWLLSWGVCIAQEHEPTGVASVTVQVVNGTQGGSAVVDDPVFLDMYRHNQFFKTIEGKAGSDGQAIFDNLPAEEHTVVVGRARHNDMMFGSSPARLVTGENPPVTVQVFEITEDQAALSVEIHHLIVELEQGTVRITEYLRLNNTSDRAVTSAQRDPQDRPMVLRLSLPQGFANLKLLSYFEAEAIGENDRGFYDTMAVPPGTHDLSYAYNLEVNSPELRVEKTVTFPTATMIVFAGIGNLELQGLGPVQGGFTSEQGTATKYYQRKNIQASDKIVFTITGFNAITGELKIWIVVAVVFGVLVVLVIVRLMRTVKINSSPRMNTNRHE